MKKIVLFAIIIVAFTACKSKSKKTETSEVKSFYQLNPETTLVNWVGYKFTEKKGVKGKFKTIQITQNAKANTIEQALKNVEVSIPVASVFSGNESRDYKLKNLFFGLMENTELIKATVTSVENNQGIMSLTLNNETHDLAFKITKQGNTAYLAATLDINTWHAQTAFKSLHKACELLHTGADGVSKTWETFDIDIIANFITE